ncbi:hypothetical protein CPR19088_GLDEOEPO_01352 [Companilactobacillus paralimentarius]
MKMIKTSFGYMTKEEIDCIGRVDKELAKEKKVKPKPKPRK